MAETTPKSSMPSMTPSYVDTAPAETAEAKVEATPGTKKVEFEVKVDPKENNLKKTTSKAQEIAKTLREEKALYKKKQSLEAKEAKWKQEQAKALEAQKTLNEFQRLSKTDPMKLLEFAGIRFEDLAKTVLKGDVRSPQEIAQQETNRLINEYKAQEQQRQAQIYKHQQDDANKAFIEQSHRQIKALATKDPDKFEFVNSSDNAISKVWETLQDAYQSGYDPKTNRATPEIEELFSPLNLERTYLDALEIVESNLEEEHFKLFSESKKIKARLAKQKADALEKEKQELEAKASQPKPKIRNSRISEPNPSTQTQAVGWPRNRLDISRKIIAERIKKNDN